MCSCSSTPLLVQAVGARGEATKNKGKLGIKKLAPFLQGVRGEEPSPVLARPLWLHSCFLPSPKHRSPWGGRGVHAKRCSERGESPRRGRKAFGLCFYFCLFEGAVGRAEWLSEHRMNAGIHTGFQHPFQPRDPLEQAPKALCRAPWEGSCCLQYLTGKGALTKPAG